MNNTHLETMALSVLKRVYLKLHCGIDNEPDSKIAESAMDYICNVIGVDSFLAWIEAATPEIDEDLGGFWDKKKK